MEVAAVVAGAVGLVAAVVAFAAWRATLRSGNRAILFVVAAFGLLALKGAAKAWSLSGGEPESRNVELLFSLVDLAVVGLVAWPLLTRRRARA